MTANDETTLDAVALLEAQHAEIRNLFNQVEQASGPVGPFAAIADRVRDALKGN